MFNPVTFLYISLAIFVIFVSIWAVRKLVNFVPQKIVIYEHEMGLAYKNGVFKSALSGGSHYMLPIWTQVEKVDLRQTMITINGQEILTLDNVALKVSAICFYKVDDPLLAKRKTVSYQDTLYAQIQMVMRELISSRSVDKILEDKQKLNDELAERLKLMTKEYGITIVNVGVKDITFPGELKKIFAEVIRAQKEGLASLERARGESAALRSLANTAKILEDNPALMNLRTLQAFSSNGNGNNTLVLTLSDMPSQIIK